MLRRLRRESRFPYSVVCSAGGSNRSYRSAQNQLPGFHLHSLKEFQSPCAASPTALAPWLTQPPTVSRPFSAKLPTVSRPLPTHCVPCSTQPPTVFPTPCSPTS